MIIAEVVDRIDTVINNNKKTEWLFIILTVILFLCGISTFLFAIYTKKFAWSVLPIFTTALLHWPIKQIKHMRSKNIALAAAPVLITQLPKKRAAEEIQKLLQQLYEGDK